jgi:hypothetical protein
MRTISLPLALVLAIVFSAACSSDAPAEPRVHLFSVEGELRQESFYVPLSRVEQLPAWSPAGGPPPVPISAIIATAEGWLFETQGLVALSVDQVDLRLRRNLHDPYRFWYYEVVFEPARRSDGTANLQPSVVVLIDGTVVVPEDGI